MVNNIPIMKMRSRLELRVFLGRYLERYFSKPIPFLDFDIADLIWAEKDKPESGMIPKCLFSSTFITSVSLKKISGLSAFIFFLENMSSIAFFADQD